MKQKFVFILFTIVFCIFALEIGARALFKFSPLAPEVTNGDYYKNDEKKSWLTWKDSIKTHPYFGFIERQTEDRLNLLMSREKKPNDYYIALLGGSVAVSISDFLEAALLNLPELKDKNIEFLDLSLGANKEPQEFFQLAYISEKFDMVIDLSGLNEMTFTPEMKYLPLEYPRLSFIETSAGKGSHFSSSLAKITKETYLFLVNLPLNLPLLAKSYFYYLFWENFSYYIFAVYDNFEHKFVQSINLPIVNDQSDKDIAKIQIQIWKKYKLLAFDLIKNKAVKYFCFVQPNQYLENSKPFSETEFQRALDKNGLSFMGYRMALLNEESLKLQKIGIPIYNLMQAFKDTKESIYIDTCCHVNALGNQIMTKKIITTIQSKMK